MIHVVLENQAESTIGQIPFDNPTEVEYTCLKSSTI